MSEQDTGRSITDEINSDPAVVERLHRSRQRVRDGDVIWDDDEDGNDEA